MLSLGCKNGNNNGNDIVPVTSVTINGDTTRIVEQGKSITLTATVMPENATDKNITWSSNNLDVAQVSPGGVVTGVKSGGSAMITAKAGGVTSDPITVEVKMFEPVESITIAGGNFSLVQGEDKKLTINVIPETANPAVTWSSDDDKVATVDEFGLVVAAEDGAGKETVIRAVSTSNPEAKASVTVTITDGESGAGEVIYEWKAEGSDTYAFASAGTTHMINGKNWTRLGGSNRNITSSGANFGNIRWTVGVATPSNATETSVLSNTDNGMKP